MVDKFNVVSANGKKPSNFEHTCLKASWTFMNECCEEGQMVVSRNRLL